MLLTQKRSHQLWGPPSLLYKGYRGLKCVKCDAGASVSNAESVEPITTLPYPFLGQEQLVMK